MANPAAPSEILVLKNCTVCGKQLVLPRSKRNTLYCTPCSELKARERNRNWARCNPPPAEYITKRVKIVNSRIKNNGLAISDQARKRSFMDLERYSGVEQAEGAGSWQVAFRVPYTKASSKNHVWSLSKDQGHVFKRQAVRAFQEAVALQVKALTTDKVVGQNKIWIDIFVQKPNHRSDAINVVDVICDGIKIGLGVDDRWFCLKGVDWEISKINPEIYIIIDQPDTRDVQACSSCGRLLLHEKFSKHSSSSSGRHRNCRDCTAKKIPESFS